MQNKARIITQSYHYFSEGIIIFLIVLAIIQFSEVMQAPYWAYLFILAGSGVLFSWFAYKKLSAIFYIFMLPILGSAFYFLLFPISLVVIFSIILPYRYWRIERTEIKRREVSLLGVAGLLVAYLMIVNGDTEIVWLFIIQFLLTFIGFYYANLPMVSRDTKPHFLSSFHLLFGSILISGVIAYFFLSEVIGRVAAVAWQGIGFLLTSLADLLLWGLSGIDPERRTVEENPDEDQGVYESELGGSVMAELENYVLIIFLIAFAVVIAAAIILFLKLRKQNRESEEELEEYGEDTIYRKPNNAGEGTRTKSLFSFFKKPDHPARKLVFQFEKKLAKTENARLQHETIENWLTRIGTGSELGVYQKARYGDGKVSDKELTDLKTELERLEHLLKEAR